MKILVTGASGFLGQRVINMCLQRQVEVHQLGLRPCCFDAPFHRADVRDREIICKTIKSIAPTHILHLASKGVTRDNSSLSDLLQINVLGTDNVLFASTQLEQRPTIYTFGTAYEYESRTQPLDETAGLSPKSIYAISKTASHHCSARYAEALQIFNLKLFNIYGPGEPIERLVPHIVNSARNGKVVELTECGQIRDFMFVDDLILILFNLLSQTPIAKFGFNTINIGTGLATRLQELVLHVVRGLHEKGIYAEIKFGALPYRHDDPMICVAENDKLIKLIGQPVFTSLYDGVGKTLNSII